MSSRLKYIMGWQYFTFMVRSSWASLSNFVHAILYCCGYLTHCFSKLDVFILVIHVMLDKRYWMSVKVEVFSVLFTPCLLAWELFLNFLLFLFKNVLFHLQLLLILLNLMHLAMNTFDLVSEVILYFFLIMKLFCQVHYVRLHWAELHSYDGDSANENQDYGGLWLPQVIEGDLHAWPLLKVVWNIKGVHCGFWLLFWYKINLKY